MCMSFGGTPLSDRLGFELGDLQHTQDSTSNISKSCQVSRLPALLGGKNRFCFFACNKHTTIVFGFYIFFPKFRVDTKFRSWLCFVKQFALWLRRDVFRHQHGEFFFPCSQPFVIPVHFWQVPALRAAAPGHVLFQSQPFWVQHLCI